MAELEQQGAPRYVGGAEADLSGVSDDRSGAAGEGRRAGSLPAYDQAAERPGPPPSVADECWQEHRCDICGTSWEDAEPREHNVNEAVMQMIASDREEAEGHALEAEERIARLESALAWLLTEMPEGWEDIARSEGRADVVDVAQDVSEGR